ncbi:calcium/sodium antiporter [Aromatoleum toluclasticum]|uniref:calcium/sodium antiporter n=1 Tax=Aromatoleum toluclasticum TaxID=92003 RepID=UPI0003667E4D|nr:calcium/sodium antiporter [Aromatoleum toluclasticum]
MNDYVGLLAGVAAAGIGGELFVRGAVGLAHWARISPGIIGATVAAFATSSPELSVSVNSALAGTPEIALGDALGSNVVNIALVLALALVIAGIQSPRDSVRRDFPVALLVPVVTGVLFLDGVLSRVDGLLMLALFAAWLSAAVMEARRQRSAAESVMGAPRVGKALASGVVGLGFLVLAGNIIVVAAKGIAASYGIDEFIIGATLVAIGTSTPELATTVIAKLRGHDEVSLGTILGSNIFNGLLIVPIAAVIHPIAIGWREVMVALVCGLVAVAVTWPPRSGFISRRRGVVLLALYAVYIVAIAQGLTS